MRKVIKYVNRVHKSQKRQSGGEPLPWDTASIARILRLLERSTIDLDMLAPFPNDKQAAVKKKGKGKKSEGEPMSSPVKSDNDDTENFANSVASGERALGVFHSAGLASQCILAILSSEGVSKQVSRLSTTHRGTDLS